MKFIIYTTDYNENIGGVIVLHQLCHELNLIGVEAYIWPSAIKVLSFENFIPKAYQLLKYHINILLGRKSYRVNAKWKAPYARYWDLKNAIIIYPEICAGNPLKSERVVRWFLNKPGARTGTIDYGENELYFYYAEAFNDEKINLNIDNKLTLFAVFDDIYIKNNKGHRKGSCYMLRKGKGRQRVHDMKSSILLDGKSHEEISQIFNQCEYFISYDLYTAYSAYAALCGCLSVVVPDSNVLKEEWKNSHGNEKYGIAYGFDEDEIAYAKETQHRVKERFEDIKRDQAKMIQSFINKCEDYFNA